MIVGSCTCCDSFNSNNAHVKQLGFARMLTTYNELFTDYYFHTPGQFPDDIYSDHSAAALLILIGQSNFL